MYALILLVAFGGPDLPAVDKFDLIGQLADHEKRLAVIEKRLGLTTATHAPTAQPVAYAASSGDCANGQCGSQRMRRGLFARRRR